MVAARPFENIAALDLAAAQIAGLAGDAAQFVEVIVVRLDLIEADRPILDGHVLRNRLCAVAFGNRAADAKIRRQKTPMQRAPMDTGAADALTRQERADAAHRQRLLI